MTKAATVNYDLSPTFSDTDVARIIILVEDAFDARARIKDHTIAQDYLYQLLFKDRS